MKRLLLLLAIVLTIGCPQPVDRSAGQARVDAIEQAMRDHARGRRMNGQYLVETERQGKKVKEQWRGICVSVIDGNTIEVFLDGKQAVRVRLESIIGTLEKGQPFGNAVKKALSDLVFDRDVIVYETGRDRYGEHSDSLAQWESNQMSTQSL